MLSLTGTSWRYDAQGLDLGANWRDPAFNDAAWPAGLALFGAANVPFVYVSVNYWRTIHPATSVVPTLPVDMGTALWFCVACFMMLFVLLLRLRVHLEEQRATLDTLYLSLDE